MIADWLGPLMFLVAFLLIFAGYPVAFSLGGTALLFAGVGAATGVLDWALLQAFPERVFGIMSNYILLAVPFFIFMGSTMGESKLAEDLLKTIGQLFGTVRGGLALAVVFVGALLAAATGVVGASVVAMGTISLPVMLRYGYSKQLAAGVIVASGTLGQIIPPSIVLVVLADQLGLSVGDVFVGALIPGLILVALFATYVLLVAWLKPASAPALPPSEHAGNKGALALQIIKVMMPPLALILLVLGSIFAGIATPTEAGALGATGALLLAAINRRLNAQVLRRSLHSTARLTSMVLFLLVGATLFTLVFRGLDGDLWLERGLTGLPGGRVGLLVVVNVTVFVLGFFLDFFEIAFIILPLVVPAARALDIDLVWLGVMLGVNLQTSFLTPPFGFSLFYLRGAAPEEVRTVDIYRGALPFIGLQLIALVLIIRFPVLVSYFR